MEINRRFAQMEQRFEKVENRLDALESEQKRQGDLIYQLIETVATTNVRLTETNERLDKLESRVETIASDVQNIKETMATRRDLEYYDQMISEHAREIYKLKNS